MALWLIKRLSPSYVDEAQGFVICAPNEASAREIANRHHGDEDVGFWTNPAFASCEPISTEGPEELILRDFLNG